MVYGNTDLFNLIVNNLLSRVRDLKNIV